MENTKKLSSSKRGKAVRDNKIVRLYKLRRVKYDNAMDLYESIADSTGCSHMTVIRVLQAKGLITPKTQQQ